MNENIVSRFEARYSGLLSSIGNGVYLVKDGELFASNQVAFATGRGGRISAMFDRVGDDRSADMATWLATAGADVQVANAGGFGRRPARRENRSFIRQFRGVIAHCLGIAL